MFIDPSNDDRIILVVDASGSVQGEFRNGQTIFKKFEEFAKELPATLFHVVFWNSDKDNAKFPNGIKKFPCVIKKENLAQGFHMINSLIHNYCTTMPHLGFEAIDDWVGTFSNTVYFMTDGQIGWNNIGWGELNNLKSMLAKSISNLTSRHPGVQIHLTTVENVHRDFSNAETLGTAAGCDVYKVISDKSLTSCIARFISITPNCPEGHVHIDQVRAPPGFLPFGDKYFSETKMEGFLEFLMNTVKEHHGDEEYLIGLVQKITGTLSVFVKDKPLKMRENIIDLFCSAFRESVLDPVMIEFMLGDSVERHQMGSAQLYASYRDSLKSLYREANRMIHKDVARAISLGTEFVTLPHEGVVVVGPSQCVTQTIQDNNSSYSRGAIELEGRTIPVIGFQKESHRNISEQCLRQWSRFVLGRKYRVNLTSDEIMYLAMMVNLQARMSDVDIDLRSWITIMLSKKRLNSDVTELDRLIKGEFPTPNDGKIQRFFDWMSNCIRLMGWKYRPCTMWYLLCSAYDQKLADIQMVHCVDSLREDFPDGVPSLNALPCDEKIKIHRIPLSAVLEYTCLVTLDDTSETGGYRFLPHRTMTGSMCCPMQVLSEAGFEGMLQSSNSCPICFTALTREHFQLIGPKEKTADRVFSEEIQPTHAAPLPPPGPAKKTLVVMKGPVGCGKTTLSSKIKDVVTQRGGKCWVEGTDQYTQMGESFSSALRTITSHLRDALNSNEEDLVVVIDTCGVDFSPKNVFKCNFSGWNVVQITPNLSSDKKMLNEYFAWSLRNVLKRGRPHSDGNYSLSPVSCGASTCVKVHQTKTSKLYGRKLVISDGESLDDVLNKIEYDARQYQNYLDTEFKQELPDF